MKKNRFLIFAFLLVFALICGPLLPNVPSSTAAQKPIPQECVESCQPLLFDCIAQGENEHRCIAAYRSCIAHCKK